MVLVQESTVTFVAHTAATKMTRFIPSWWAKVSNSQSLKVRWLGVMVDPQFMAQ